MNRKLTWTNDGTRRYIHHLDIVDETGRTVEIIPVRSVVGHGDTISVEVEMLPAIIVPAPEEE